MAVEVSIGGPDDGRDKYGDQPAKMIELLEQYVTERDRLKHALGEISECSLDEIQQTINVVNFYANKLSRSWGSLVDCLIDGDQCADNKDAIAAISTLWNEDDNDRVLYLKEICPVADIQAISEEGPDRIKGIIQKAYDLVFEYPEIDDKVGFFKATLLDKYSEYVASDVNSFLDAIITIKRANNLSHEQDKKPLAEMLKKYGLQAVKAATVATSVAVGIIVGSKIVKKQND